MSVLRPDVLGLRLERAVNILDRFGMRYAITHTTAFGKRVCSHYSRVVRQSTDADGVVWLVAAPTSGEPNLHQR